MKVHEHTLYKIVKAPTEWYQVYYKRDFIFSFLFSWRIATNEDSNDYFSGEGFDKSFSSEKKAMKFIDDHPERFQQYILDEVAYSTSKQKIDDYNDRQHIYKRSGL